MPDPRTKYRTNFNFSLSFPGGRKNDAAFQEASGLTKDMKTEEVGCGGENRFKYRLPGAISFQRLILKRGVAPIGSDLIEWCRTVLDGGLVDRIETKNMQLNLLNDQRQTCMKWTFVNAYPLKWAAGDFNSQNGKVLIETIELGFNYFDLAKEK